MAIYQKYFNADQINRLTTTEPDWGISVLNVGHNIHPSHKKYPETNHPENYFFNWSKGRKLDEFQLIYIASGSGELEAEHSLKIAVGPGTVFFLHPHVWHRYKPDEKSGWEEYWVGFKGIFADHLMNQDCFDSHNPLIHIGFNTEFLNVFVRLIDTLKYEGVAFSQMASCFTIQLLGLVYASALLKEKPHNRQTQVIDHIRYRMHERWAQNINMEKLAAEHYVSYAWFRKAFKTTTGVSPGQYLINLKIERGSQLLKETDLGISDIAFKLGFVSEHHFSNLFKKKTGVPPSVYRENNLLN